jgi:hypothetical protein
MPAYGLFGLIDENSMSDSACYRQPTASFALTGHKQIYEQRPGGNQQSRIFALSVVIERLLQSWRV